MAWWQCTDTKVILEESKWLSCEKKSCFVCVWIHLKVQFKHPKRTHTVRHTWLLAQFAARLIFRWHGERSHANLHASGPRLSGSPVSVTAIETSLCTEQS